MSTPTNPGYEQQPGPVPPGYAPQGAPQAPPPPPPKKKKGKAGKIILFSILGLVLLIVLINLFSGGGDGDGGPADDPPASEAMPALGDAVVVDDLEFTLTNYECGVTVKDVTEEALEPQGQFCKIDVAVKNVGKEEALLSDEAVKLLTSDEIEYSASSDTLFVDGVLVFETINPGNTVEGTVYFDVPEDAEPSVAAVGGGLFSEPVQVSLA